MTRTISTEAELDALIVQSVVLLSSGQVFARVDQTPGGCDWQGIGTEDYWWPRGIISEHDGPITVLWDAGQPAPTVRPSRDDVACLVDPHLWSPTYSGFRNFGDSRTSEEILEEEREHARTKADAVLALLPGRTEAEVKAEALREAADQEAPAAVEARRWLRARVDEVERGEGRG